MANKEPFQVFVIAEGDSAHTHGNILQGIAVKRKFRMLHVRRNNNQISFAHLIFFAFQREESPALRNVDKLREVMDMGNALPVIFIFWGGNVQKAGGQFLKVFIIKNVTAAAHKSTSK